MNDIMKLPGTTEPGPQLKVIGLSGLRPRNFDFAPLPALPPIVHVASGSPFIRRDERHALTVTAPLLDVPALRVSSTVGIGKSFCSMPSNANEEVRVGSVPARHSAKFDQPSPSRSSYASQTQRLARVTS